MVWLFMRFLVSSDGFVVLRNFDINWSSIQIIHAKCLGGLTSLIMYNVAWGCILVGSISSATKVNHVIFSGRMANFHENHVFIRCSFFTSPDSFTLYIVLNMWR